MSIHPFDPRLTAPPEPDHSRPPGPTGFGGLVLATLSTLLGLFLWSSSSMMGSGAHGGEQLLLITTMGTSTLALAAAVVWSLWRTATSDAKPHHFAHGVARFSRMVLRLLLLTEVLSAGYLIHQLRRDPYPSTIDHHQLIHFTFAAGLGSLLWALGTWRLVERVWSGGKRRAPSILSLAGIKHWLRLDQLGRARARRKQEKWERDNPKPEGFDERHRQRTTPSHVSCEAQRYRHIIVRSHGRHSDVYGQPAAGIAASQAGFDSEDVDAGAAGEVLVGGVLEEAAHHVDMQLYHGLKFNPSPRATGKADMDHAFLLGPRVGNMSTSPFLHDLVYRHDPQLDVPVGTVRTLDVFDAASTIYPLLVEVDAKMWGGGRFDWVDGETIERVRPDGSRKTYRIDDARSREKYVEHTGLPDTSVVCLVVLANVENQRLMPEVGDQDRAPAGVRLVTLDQLTDMLAGMTGAYAPMFDSSHDGLVGKLTGALKPVVVPVDAMWPGTTQE